MTPLTKTKGREEARTDAPAAARKEIRETRSLVQHVADNPYAVVAGAFGVGFVLGGGLFTRLTARIAKVALRAGLVAALPHLQAGLLANLNGSAGGTLGTLKNGTDKNGAAP
ncbi:MAG: hypothetical protein H7X95_07160, partial [Deltaproteobacteria bacterium]|nr:hypothetical protein [Deltaproteobacteria bacterium]